MKNISVNDISCVNKLEEFLIPIQEILIIKRGERNGWNALFYPPENSGIESEYIKPALIKPALLKSFMVQSDRAVFCCHKSKEELRQLGHTLLNSLSGMFAIKAARETDGVGVSSTKLRSMYMINPRVISDSDALEIVELFNKIKNRNVMDIEDELKDSDREIFDRKVLQAVGHEEIYDALKESLLLYTRYD